jgi:hypothetical protein
MNLLIFYYIMVGGGINEGIRQLGNGIRKGGEDLEGDLALGK